MNTTRSILRPISNPLYIRKDFLLKSFPNFNGKIMTLGHKVTEKWINPYSQRVSGEMYSTRVYI